MVARGDSVIGGTGAGAGAEFQGFALRKSESGDSEVHDSDNVEHL